MSRACDYYELKKMVLEKDITKTDTFSYLFAHVMSFFVEVFQVSDIPLLLSLAHKYIISFLFHFLSSIRQQMVKQIV